MVSLAVILAVLALAALFVAGISLDNGEIYLSVCLIMGGSCALVIACALFFALGQDCASNAVKCPECGTTYYDGQMFCPDDGTKLEKEVR